MEDKENGSYWHKNITYLIEELGESLHPKGSEEFAEKGSCPTVAGLEVILRIGDADGGADDLISGGGKREPPPDLGLLPESALASPFLEFYIA